MANQLDQDSIDRLTETLLAYLLERTESPEDAADLAQEALLRLYKLDQQGRMTNAQGFLFKTVNNLLVDRKRKSEVHARFLETANEIKQQVSAVPSAERAITAAQELETINEALANLAPKARQAFLMSRAQDMSYSEISAALGVSNSMVEKYIVQALKALRSARV